MEGDVEEELSKMQSAEVDVRVRCFQFFSHSFCKH